MSDPAKSSQSTDPSGRLFKPSDFAGYVDTVETASPRKAPRPAAPAKKLPWQTELIRRSVAEGMRPGHQHIALVLSTFSNHDGTNARPSIARLVKDSGTSTSTATRALRYLRDHGWVEQVSQGNGIAGKTSVYRLTIPS